MRRFTVYHAVLRSGVIVAGILAVSLLGCQSDAPTTGAGSMPALELDPQRGIDASTYFAHAHLLERQGEFQQAAEQYREALERSPNMVSARNRLGITLNKLRQHAEATAQFRLAIRLQPTQAYIHNNLGFSLYLEGLYDQAAQSFQRAIELRPDYPRAHMNYGIVLARLGRYNDALQEFRLVGSEADAHYNLAVLHTEAGQFAEAAHLLETALALNPKFEAAREQLHVVAHLAAEAEQPVPQPQFAQGAEQPIAEGTSPTLAQNPPPGEQPKAPVLPPLAYENQPPPGPLSPEELELVSLMQQLVAAAHQDQDAYERILAQVEQRMAALQAGK
ncbi:MAG: tetratricopeptide repeat protein [Phycisphaerae bacterium]|jgi:Tfp pilus assembly protein PilF